MPLDPGRVEQLVCAARAAGLGQLAFQVVRRLLPARAMGISWFELSEVRPRRLPAAHEASGRGSGPAGETFRWVPPERATRADGEAIAGLGSLTREQVWERFAYGDGAYVANHGDRTVGYVWYTQQQRSIDGVFRIELAADELWCYDALIARGHRGAGLATRLVHHATATFESAGLARRLDAHNVPHRRVRAINRRAGGRPLLRVAALRLGPVTVCRYRPSGAGRARWKVFTGVQTLRPDRAGRAILSGPDLLRRARAVIAGGGRAPASPMGGRGRDLAALARQMLPEADGQRGDREGGMDD